MSSAKLDISVIIPVFGAHQLLPLLVSLASQLDDTLSGEIILVDNNPDPDRGLIDLHNRYPHVKYIHQQETGSYSARNQAIAIARGEVLAFTDADCLPATSWLANGYRSIVGGAHLVAGRIVLGTEQYRPANSVEAYEMLFAFRQRETVSRHNYGVTANLFTPRALFDELGAFNSHLLSGGDIEWCTRAAKAGYSIRYEEDVVVSHPPRTSLNAILRKGKRVAGGQAQLRTKVPLMEDYFSHTGVLKAMLPPFRQYKTIFANDEMLTPGLKCKVAAIATLNKFNIALWRYRYALGLGGSLERR